MAKYTNEEIDRLVTDFFNYVNNLNDLNQDSDFVNDVKEKIEKYFEEYNVDTYIGYNTGNYFDKKLFHITIRLNEKSKDSLFVKTYKKNYLSFLSYKLINDEDLRFTCMKSLQLYNSVETLKTINIAELLNADKLWNKLKIIILNSIDVKYYNDVVDGFDKDKLATISKIKLKREFFSLYQFFMTSFNDKDKVDNLFSDEFIDKNSVTFKAADELCEDVYYVVRTGMKIFDEKPEYVTKFYLHSNYKDLKFLVDEVKNKK
jgi:hypothetical protein